jgi:antitoxin YefM
MQTINYPTAQDQLTEIMDSVNAEKTVVLVTRDKGEPVVIMSLAEFNAFEETAYLLKSSKNALRLINSMENLRAGRAR